MNTEVQVFRYLKGFALLPSAIGPKISHHPFNQSYVGTKTTRGLVTPVFPRFTQFTGNQYK